ncbi:MAG: hypothetical protein KAI69_08090 [Deltaproteobacteria bacterium]|nr:hypothetical protein [Deltaproteobacteria bacterium]
MALRFLSRSIYAKLRLRLGRQAGRLVEAAIFMVAAAMASNTVISIRH